MVGAILASEDGEILARAHRGTTERHGAHAEYQVIEQAKSDGVDLSRTSLFVTLEPCTVRGGGKTPCATRIIEGGIPRIHIGMLDPNPSICGRGETFLRYKIAVERFPDGLVREIQNLNAGFVNQYKSAHLDPSSIYVQQRISDLITNQLQRGGIDIDDVPYEWDVTVDELELFCAARSKLARKALRDLVHHARADAFDAKYANYSYERENDARSLGDEWKNELRDIFRLLHACDYPQRRLIDVGVGNGLEAVGLFDDLAHFTGVDIGTRSIENAKKRLKLARFAVAEAEDLRDVGTGSQDIYVSLRTYQSAYFDIDSAVREAYRIVRQGGLIVVSVSNGYLGMDRGLIPGLAFPRSNFVSRDRPFEVAERIRKKFTLLRFEEVGVRTGFAEIYVYGRRGR